MEYPGIPPTFILEQMLKRVREERDGPDARVQVCSILLQLNKFEEAAAEAREAIRAFPDCGQLHGFLGVALDGLGSSDEAVRHLETAYELTRENQHLLIAASIKRMARRWAEAEEFLNVAILNAPDPAAYALHGELLMAQFRFAEAIDCFIHSQQLDPENMEVRAHLAEALMSSDRPLEAVIICDDLLEQDPHFARASFIRARCIWEFGDLDDALSSFKSALAWETDELQRALFFYGYGLTLDEYDESEASAAFTRAYTLNPQLGAAYVAHAELSDDIYEALEILQLGYVNCPQDMSVCLKLADVLTQLGRVDDGLEVIRGVSPLDEVQALEKIQALVYALTEDLRWREAVNELLTYAVEYNRAGFGICFPAVEDVKFGPYALDAAQAHEQMPDDLTAVARLSCVLYCFRSLPVVFDLLCEFERWMMCAPWGIGFIRRYHKSLARRRHKFADGINSLIKEYVLARGD